MLMFAVKLRRLEIVKFLVENTSIDVEKKDNQGLTALCHAFEEKDVNIIEYLLSQGANPHVVLEDGSTLFHLTYRPYYLSYNMLRIVPLLLSKQVDVNRCDKNGISPILLALMKFKDHYYVFQDAIPQLLNANPNLFLTLTLNVFKALWQNIPENYWPEALKNAPESFKGSTSLMHVAIYLNEVQAVKLLLDKGLEQERDYFGFTPIELAKHLNYKDIVWILQYQPFYNALINGDVSKVKQLLQEGDIDLNVDYDGLTALGVVLKGRGNHESILGIVKLLLAKNIDVNRCAKGEFTPIFEAVSKLDEPILSGVIALLLTNGANQKAKLHCKVIRKELYPRNVPTTLKKAPSYKLGHTTLLHVAVRYESEELIGKLLSSGVEQEKDYCGFTPMELAASLKHEKILGIFEEYQEQVNVVNTLILESETHNNLQLS